MIQDFLCLDTKLTNCFELIYLKKIGWCLTIKNQLHYLALNDGGQIGLSRRQYGKVSGEETEP
jgi:hypothetical protein